MTILDQIVKNKTQEIELLKQKNPIEKLLLAIKKLPKKKTSFYDSLKKIRGVAVIAEIKKRSPSKGILRKNFRPVAIAESYERAGASALSVLTDENFFGGSVKVLKKVRGRTKLPILRKDFILDLYQIYEARIIGADAILLIADILSKEELEVLSKKAFELGLDVLFEVHTPEDVDKILPLKPKMVGINNRDLHTFKVDLGVTERLLKRFPKKTLIVSESGIQSPEDLLYLKRLGVDAVLIGESLMRENDPGKALKNLKAVL